MRDSTLKILEIPKGVDKELFISERCKIYTETSISVEYGLGKDYVKEISKKYKIPEYLKSLKVNNPIIYPFQEQIILGGLIGDGRIKPNGYGYIYSECHTMDEREYCEWKYLNLGDITKGIRMYGKNFNNRYSKAVEFCTRSVKELGYYYNMSKSEVISRLNMVGLMLLILDDGWFSKHSHSGNFCLSGGSLTVDELNLLCEKYENIGIECHIVGNKRYDISFSSSCNISILNYTSTFLPLTLDVCLKKFAHIFDTSDTYNKQPSRSGRMLKYNS